MEERGQRLWIWYQQARFRWAGNGSCAAFTSLEDISFLRHLFREIWDFAFVFLSLLSTVVRIRNWNISHFTIESPSLTNKQIIRLKKICCQLRGVCSSSSSIRQQCWKPREFILYCVSQRQRDGWGWMKFKWIQVRKKTSTVDQALLVKNRTKTNQ